MNTKYARFPNEKYIALIRDIIADCKGRKKSITVVSLDFDKVLDGVAQSFLFSVLRKMGFPDSFVDLLVNLYKGAKSTVQINVFLTEPFDILWGVRQGFP